MNIEHIFQIFDLGGQDPYKFLIKGMGNKNNSVLNGAHLIIGFIDPLTYEISKKYINSVFDSMKNFNIYYVVTKKDLMDDDDDNDKKTLEDISKMENLMPDNFSFISNYDKENVEMLKKKIINIVSLDGNYVPKSEDVRYSKIIFLGIGGAGKTSLCNMLELGEMKETKLTIGLNVKTAKVSYCV
jgi:predicted GTPase